MSQNISLHQCLFGYDDGHRLLAASTNLAAEALSQLLPLTDLAPGLNFASLKSYWTGIPIPSMKAYALIRTWPAPEMPRPGCVWSHVLLIAFADIPRFVTLRALAECTSRPQLAIGFSSYETKVKCELHDLSSLD